MKFKRIVITGVPGTGKTTLSKKLAGEIDEDVMHINSGFIRNKGLVDEDLSGPEVNVNLKKLRKFLLNEEGIMESHLLCEIKLPDSLVIVLRCNPEILRERLKVREYSEEKLRENLECEALDYCTQLSKKNYEKVYELDSSKRSVKELVEECKKIIRERSSGDKDIDYSEFLLK